MQIRRMAIGVAALMVGGVLSTGCGPTKAEKEMAQRAEQAATRAEDAARRSEAAASRVEAAAARAEAAADKAERMFMKGTHK